MIKLLKALFTGCWCSWETIETRELSSAITQARGVRYILRCKRCGNIKNADIL